MTGASSVRLLSITIGAAPLKNHTEPVYYTPWTRLALALGARPATLIFVATVMWLTRTPDVWMNLAAVPIDLLTLHLVHRMMAEEGRRLRDLLWPWHTAHLAWGLLLGIIVAAAYLPAEYLAAQIAYLGTHKGESTTYPEVPLWLGIWTLTLMPITVALAEESLYRAYIQPRVRGHAGTVGAILLASVFYGLQHVSMGIPLTPDCVHAVLRSFLLGLVYALIVQWQRRVAPAVVAHWVAALLGVGMPVLIESLGGR
ncbi:CPBP family intramembrane glutamic endopeptidase [Actinomyces trachealis]|uniref:CPBP family intramembrane glutamic endopeptidase n=1 Tax=Actinomyces trachealis TaxID=2763540 RepID=UPI0018928E12|nr:CPBP family intramembrane glutamic endopeptidase [Actinomyces trachealis]